MSRAAVVERYMVTLTYRYPRLVADIGGTNARFSLEYEPYTYQHTAVLACKDYKSLSEAILCFLRSLNLDGKIDNAALALPTPTLDDSIFMVNSPWQTFSMQQTREEVGIKNIIFLNDFHALALSVPHIDAQHLVRVGGTCDPDINKPCAIIGPGTGLGMATLIKHPLEGYLAIPAEGGRASFSPVNAEEIELWEFAHRRFSHVSAERFLSGPGLQLIYEGLCKIQGIPITSLPTPAEITEKGINGTCWTCAQTINQFCRMLGTIASNLAVMVNSFGGVYIGGGIVPKMLSYFIQSQFRSRFEDKGRYRPFLVKMPAYVITHNFPAFLGASYALDVYLTKGYIP
jgi:glucokinase